MTEPKRADQTAAELRLLSPLDGVLVPLESVPDPVFAQKLVGDGIAVDPTSGTLTAPCSGTVVQLHRAHHAITLCTDGDVQILLHIGLDTVKLEGKGFKPCVGQGDTVSAGQPLIEFDLDEVATQAKSLLTIVVVTAGAPTVRVPRSTGLVRGGADELFSVPTGSSLSGAAQAGGDGLPAGETSRSETLTLVNPNGLHARPAAKLVSAAKAFSAQLTLHKGERRAAATSVSEIMALDTAQGDEIWLSASGPDAREALTQLATLISEGLGEEATAAGEGSAPAQRFESQDAAVLGGVPASPGLAVGRVHRLQVELPAFPSHSADGEGEKNKLQSALAAVQQELAAEVARFRQGGSPEKAEIFSAHVELLDDAALVAQVQQHIASGASAPAAWNQVTQVRAQSLRELSNPLMRQRADDIVDVATRVLLSLCGKTQSVQRVERPAVVVCDDLTPSAAALLDAESTVAIVSRGGGATSHAAIIARSMGVPYVASVGTAEAQLVSGAQVIVDGELGRVDLAPSEERLREVRAEVERRESKLQAQLAAAQEKAKTQDSRAIEVAANIGNAEEAAVAAKLGADGVGLLRSEFMFLGRRQAPTEEEQGLQYERIAQELGSQRSLVVRTLDVGGDKPLSYLPLPDEDNPFLGVRGIRLSLRHPELFDAQLRSLLKAARYTKLNVMFPMVAQFEEFLLAKQRLKAQAAALGVTEVSIGVMVEVPSAVMMSDLFAEEVDFFSVGTNDLTQYTLAMDRGHSELSAQADALDPAVLRMIDMLVKAARMSKRKPWVGICGGLAADALATPLLVGLGVTELSVPAPDVAPLKARIRELSYLQCTQLAKKALRLPDALSVRELLAQSPKGLSIRPKTPSQTPKGANA